MVYRLKIYREKRWQKDLAVFTKSEQTKFLDTIESLLLKPWPPNLDIKKLTEYAGADYRLRIGDYRVLFDRDDNCKMITLYRILHRSKIY